MIIWSLVCFRLLAIVRFIGFKSRYSNCWPGKFLLFFRFAFAYMCDVVGNSLSCQKVSMKILKKDNYGVCFLVQVKHFLSIVFFFFFWKEGKHIGCCCLCYNLLCYGLYLTKTRYLSLGLLPLYRTVIYFLFLRALLPPSL